MPFQGDHCFCVEPHENGRRLDVFLACRLPEFSRALLAHLIDEGLAEVNGIHRKPSYKLKPFEEIRLKIPAPKPTQTQAQAIALDLLYEDDDLIVINKQAGMVVHPAAGHEDGTLVNALLHHCPDLGGIGGELRPGIVHRLDKDTSGVLIVAKNGRSHELLADQFKSRKVGKEYLALVFGTLGQEHGIVDQPIGRHPVERKKMAIAPTTGRSAVTHWRVLERLCGTSLISLDLKTGRTHQIRVHCQSMGHPIVGDQVYGSKRWLRQLLNDSPQLFQIVKGVGRQMLHAAKLTVTHPRNAEPLCFSAPLPSDMAYVLSQLRTLAK